MRYFHFLMIPACVSLALGQESPPVNTQTTEPLKPSVTKLDEFRYKIGDVILDRKTREIRFPTKVNMNEGLLEYLIVLQQGKVHEALMISTITPTHLNLALVLLRYTPSSELFSLINETGHPTGIYQDVAAPVKAAARITLDVEWDDNGTTRRVPVNEWVRNNSRGVGMEAGPWLYTGSSISNKKFIPDLSGDITSIMTDSNAMINYPGADNQDSPAWFAFPKRIPPVGTPVTVIIAPYRLTK